MSYRKEAMRDRFYILMLCCALGLGTGWAQIDASQQPVPLGEQQQPPDTTQQQSGGAVPAGQDNAAAVSNDNPPLSGLDQPSLEPRAAARSFLIPGAHISQSLDSNIGGGTGSVAGVTRALGSITLQRLWSRYNVGLDYVGGGAFYPNYSVGATQVHQLDEKLAASTRCPSPISQMAKRIPSAGSTWNSSPTSVFAIQTSLMTPPCLVKCAPR